MCLPYGVWDVNDSSLRHETIFFATDLWMSGFQEHDTGLTEENTWLIKVFEVYVCTQWFVHDLVLRQGCEKPIRHIRYSVPI